MEKTLPRGAGGFSERDCREDKWCDTPRREGRRERNGVRHPVTGHVATFQVRSKLGTVNSPDGTLFRTPLGAFFQRSRKEEGRLKTLAACRNSGITFLPPSFLAGFKLIKPEEDRESILSSILIVTLLTGGRISRLLAEPQETWIHKKWLRFEIEPHPYVRRASLYGEH